MSVRKKILPFVHPAERRSSAVGRVHHDGSITFLGRTYATIKDLPPECLALRADVETYRQWRRLYRAVAPDSRRDR